MKKQNKKYDYNQQLQGLSQFLYILQKSKTMLPHNAVDTMIKYNQKMDGVRNYLQSIINDIDNKGDSKCKK